MSMSLDDIIKMNKKGGGGGGGRRGGSSGQGGSSRRAGAAPRPVRSRQNNFNRERTSRPTPYTRVWKRRRCNDWRSNVAGCCECVFITCGDVKMDESKHRIYPKPCVCIESVWGLFGCRSLDHRCVFHPSWAALFKTCSSLRLMNFHSPRWLLCVVLVFQQKWSGEELWAFASVPNPPSD